MLTAAFCVKAKTRYNVSMAVRLAWFGVVAIVVAFAAQTFFGSLLVAAADDDVRAIRVRDQFKNDMHELSGMVMVPSACHDLTVRTKDIDPQTTALVFETWEQPYRECPQELTPKAFRVVVYAPENIIFKAIMDNSWTQLRIEKAL